MIEIIPAIMPTSFSDLEQKLSRVARYVPTVQIDIMDGVFVKSRSWPYYSSDKLSLQKLLSESEGLPYWDELNFEIDLMVSKPEEVIDTWVTLGAARLVLHVESEGIGDGIKKIHERLAYKDANTKPDIELGLALNLTTPTENLTSYLEDIQFVQFMGIKNIGLQGEPFDEEVIDKIRDFHSAHPEIIVSVDGGVDLNNAKALVEAGVKRLVSGSAIFEGPDVQGIIEEFRKRVL